MGFNLAASLLTQLLSLDRGLLGHTRKAIAKTWPQLMFSGATVVVILAVPW